MKSGASIQLMMDQLKQFIMRNREKILVGIILVAVFAGAYFIEEKSVILNFYFLPVLSAGHFFWRCMGLLTAIFSILEVAIFASFFPEAFLKMKKLLSRLAKLSSWVGFLSW